MTATATDPHAAARAARLQRLQRLLAADPANVALRGECVTLALQQRDYTEALTLLEPVAQGEHVPAAVWQNKGLCHFLLGDYAAARDCLRRAYVAGDRSADVLHPLISSLHRLGELDEAVRIAGEAGAAASGHAPLAGVLALLYLDAGDAAQAAEWAAQTLRLDPDSLDALVSQGTLRIGSGDAQTARRQFERALQLAPHTARAWLGLALASLSQNDLVHARVQIERCLQYMPEHVGSWHVLAWIDLLEGNLEAAQASFERSLDLDRNFAESHGGLASVLALRGERAAAERAIEIAERLDRASLAAKFARSVLLGGPERSAEARQLLSGAMAGISLSHRAGFQRAIKAVKTDD